MSRRATSLFTEALLPAQTKLLQTKTKLGQIGGGGLRIRENAARCVAEEHQL